MTLHETAANRALAAARSFLFVPANRPERFAKALTSGADAVIFDLEDAVPLEAKQAARTALAQAWPTLQQAGVPMVVRINADPAFGDLEWLAELAPPTAVMVPKAESAAALQRAAGRLPAVALLPLIETAAGYLALREIAAAPQVLRLAFGHVDFMADTGIHCSDDERELDPLRFAIAMATRANGLSPAIDGVTLALDDDHRLREDTRRALRFGFCGKLCIHPRQVGVVHEAMEPSEEQLRWAERVLAADVAAGGAAVQLDGRMVDLPVVLQARRTLARARRPSSNAGIAGSAMSGIDGPG